MSIRIMWLGAALTLSVSTVSRGQSPMTLAHAARQFQSGTMPERIRAFYALDRVPGNWTQLGAAQALLALVKREDSLIVAVLRESGGRLAAGDKYGEGYAEYDGQLLDRCLKYCDREALLTDLLANLREVPELRLDRIDLLANTYADSGFSPGQRVRIVSAIIAASRDSTSFLTRGEALRVLKNLLPTDGALTPAQRTAYHAAIVQAAGDRYANIRELGVSALGNVGGPADVPLLERIAASDSDTTTRNGHTVYPIRDQARIALAIIAYRARAP